MLLYIFSMSLTNKKEIIAIVDLLYIFSMSLTNKKEKFRGHMRDSKILGMRQITKKKDLQKVY